VKDTPFGQPSLHDGMDVSLLTLGEIQRIGRLQQQHERLVAARARELRFSPDLGLSDRERTATLRCMTYPELRPLMTCGAIYRKAERMMEKLAFDEQVDVRIFSQLTIHFSAFGPCFRQVDDAGIYIWTERYRRIMQHYDLPTFGDPYGFLPEDRKQRVLAAGSTVDLDEALKDLEGEGDNGTVLSPKGV
jgi:hypothetical protein